MKKSMLLSTIAMIVVVVVALSTATFAWFSAQGQNAITGTMTVQASKDFVINVVDNSAWAPAGDTIDIANGLGGGISPVSPSFALDAANKYAAPGATADVVPTMGTNKWYTTTGTANKYATLSQATQGFAITSFQIKVGDGTVQNAVKMKTQIKVDNNAANLAALKGVRVVFQVTDYDDTGAKVGDSTWYGTTYKYGGTGLVDENGEIVTDQTWKTASGAGTEKEYTGITNAAAATYTALNVPGNTFTSIAAADKDVFIVSGSAESGKEDGMYRTMEETISFAANATKTVTVYVWLDGHAVDDAAGGKTVSIQVSFTK
ncbi:MAG: hypothetical protein ACI4MO_05165 [Christensenellales bacterium]